MNRDSEIFSMAELTGNHKDYIFPIFNGTKQIASLEISAPDILKKPFVDGEQVIAKGDTLVLTDETLFGYCQKQRYWRRGVPQLNICDYAIVNASIDNGQERPPECSVEIKILRADKFGNQFSSANMAKLVSRRLFQKFNYAFHVFQVYSDIDHREIKFLKFTSMPQGEFDVSYGVDFSHLYCGAYQAITEDFVLEILCSRTRFHKGNSQDAYRDQLQQFADSILSTVRLVPFSASPQQAASAIDDFLSEDIVVDKCVVIQSVAPRARHQVESDLLAKKIIGIEDCTVLTIIDADARAKLIEDDEDDEWEGAAAITDSQMKTFFSDNNFLSEDLVAPLLNFENFQGVIKIPQAKNPECPIQQEIQREMMACYQGVKAMTE